MSWAAPVVPQRRVAVMAYGSLLYDPGPDLGPLVQERIPRRTPFPVEYGRVSAKWGGGPVLVPHPDGGRVEGALLVLTPACDLGRAVEALRVREGLAGPEGVVEVAAGDADLMVIAASLPRNLPLPDMTPPELARRAADSVVNGSLNGVAYLRGALEAGIETPRSRAYAREILELAGVDDLEEAERRLVAFRDRG